MTQKTIGGFMARLRKTAGYTQQEVAEKLNVSNRTLSSWETDRTVPDVLMLPVIAELYGITVDELLRGEKTQNIQIAPQEIELQKDPLKEQYDLYYRKRNIFTFLCCLCALTVFTGFTIMLYSAAPLWLYVSLMFAGVIGNIIFIVSIFKSENLTLQNSESAVKQYLITLRHKTAISLFINASAYFVGALILFICYCTVYTNSEISGTIYEQFDACNGTAIILCLTLCIILILTGVLNNVLYINCLGNAEQKNNIKSNTRLLKKISLFGIIPVALSLIPFVVLSYVTLPEISHTYFTVNSVDEVYKNLQTLTLYSTFTDFDDKNDILTVIPKGEYYLNFQSETFIKCRNAIGYGTKSFCDLGNNFYASYGIEWADIYYLKNGITVEYIDPNIDYTHYFVGIIKNAKKVCFTSPNGEELSAFSFTYNSDTVYYNYFYNDYSKTVLTRNGDVYNYQSIAYYDYSPTVFYVFISTTLATVLTCLSIHLIKRKKQYYSF